MEDVIAKALGHLLSWEVLSLAGGVYFLLVVVKILIGQEVKDKPLINRLLFVAPFLVCVGVAFVPGMFSEVSTWGGALRMGLWTGGVSIFYHVFLKFLLGDKIRKAMSDRVASLIGKGSP